MTAHDPRVTLTEAEREAIWAGLRRARHEEAPIPLAHEFHKTHVLWAVGPAVERIIAARLAPIRALAEEGFNLTRPYGERCETCSTQYLEVGVNLTNLLRAALDATGADLSASQDHDGAEGQGEVPWSRQRVHIHPPYEPTCNERRVDGQLRGACLNDDGSPR